METAVAFEFRTKAQNLEQLKDKITKSKILDLFFFTVKEWLQNKEAYSQALLQFFGYSKMAVRSSSTCEDSFETSLAGQFESVLNVDPDIYSIQKAIHQVIASYEQYSSSIESFEILVQPMAESVACSGVLFTRTLEHFAPYYVINYDDTSLTTDTVTNGSYEADKSILIRKSVQFEASFRWGALIEAARELEQICNCDYLDIEFAIDDSGQVYILQVRPIATGIIRQHNWIDKTVQSQIDAIKIAIAHRFRTAPALRGQTTLLGQMPDWNPVEIIGSRPKPLAYSLYRYLITDFAWRQGRSRIGYQSPDSYGLMVQVAGRPYIDVRVSFHSLLPTGLSEALSEKLVNYYVEQLRRNPHFHDKVEFYVLHTCMDFSFGQTHEKLIEHGFTEAEVTELKQALISLTRGILHDTSGQLVELRNDLDKLGQRRELWTLNKTNPAGYLTAVEFLLKDCISYGTIPFSAFARCAFIGTQLLRSLNQEGVVSDEDVQHFLNSIETVTGQYAIDLESYAQGLINKEDLCSRYGHLRPGTYDITTARYDENPNLYFIPNRLMTAHKIAHEFNFTREQQNETNKLLRYTGLDIDCGTLLDFIKSSIAMREKVKFEFTKNLSLALRYIRLWGEYHGISAEDAAFIPIEQLLRGNQELGSNAFVSQCKRLIDEQKFVYQQQSQILVPDIITDASSLDVIEMIKHSPNFTSEKRLLAEVICLDDNNNDYMETNIAGKIVLIEQADPGYDWLFARGIAGLITKYGGVASHMAVRCAEFGIPAAIGCGELLYQRLKQAKTIELNCQEKRVLPAEGMQ